MDLQTVSLYSNLAISFPYRIFCVLCTCSLSSGVDPLLFFLLLFFYCSFLLNAIFTPPARYVKLINYFSKLLLVLMCVECEDSTKSMTTLYWQASKSTWPQYVTSRVKAVHELGEWTRNFVFTDQSPSDLGCNAIKAEWAIVKGTRIACRWSILVRSTWCHRNRTSCRGSYPKNEGASALGTRQGRG